MSDKALDRLSKVLRQAENAATEAEAAAFMEAAQKLSTLHSIDLAKARHHSIAKERTVPITKTIDIAERGEKGAHTYVTLWSGIADANDLMINIAHNSTYVILFGYSEDIDAAELLYNSLRVQMTEATLAYQKAGEWKQTMVETHKRVWDPEYFEYFWRTQEKPINWLTARLSFQKAYAGRIGTRLRLAKREAVMERENADPHSDAVVAGDEPTTALVLREKEEKVASFYKEKSNARGSYRGGRNQSHSSHARRAGASAADNARLSAQSQIANKKEI